MTESDTEMKESLMKSNGEVTAAVAVTCVVAATSGLIFGYDIGISGGVTTMASFLQKFLPDILTKKEMATQDMYCVYDSQILTAFTSSLYIAGLVSSLSASRLSASLGRRNTTLIGGCTFFAGGAINAAADNIAMLIVGRILLGFGVGFTCQAAPLYLSEVAPPKWRGAFNTGYQFFNGIGVVCANCLNYALSKDNIGWRISLGGAMVPAVIMTGGALLISDSPSSLVERGMMKQARDALARIRGDTQWEAELENLVKCSAAAKASEREALAVLFERQQRPHLVMALAIPFFQQLTGINVLAFYAPILFQSVGFGSDSSLVAAVILAMVNLVSILVSSALVDRVGRRRLFIVGGILMFVCQIAVAAVLAASSGMDGTKDISKGSAATVLALICVYAAGFGLSWGPLSVLIPSEIFPMKIRPMGQSISVAVSFAVTFVLSQTFLTTLCHFKFGIFLFYGGWIAFMTVFVVLFLPETSGIPLDSINSLWSNHWFWRRYLS